MYYKYLESNFHKFNIILFVVDIQSGLNTSDEIDILNFLAKNINKHKIKSNKNINMLTIVNKADDMQLSNIDKLEVLGEWGEMFEQTKNTIKQIFKKENIEASSVDCIPICGLDAHLYRMIKKYKDIKKLSREHILRIGINEEGSKFRRCSPDEQTDKVREIIKDNKFVESMIKLSGFSQIETCLNKFIGVKGNSMVVENILWELNSIPELTINILIPSLKRKIIVLSKLPTYDIAKYDEEMKKIIKQMNTLIYKRINTIDNPIKIKEYYDAEIIDKIISDNIVAREISKFCNVSTYPSYFTDRILELVIKEFSEHAIPVSKLSYIKLFENIGNLKTEIIDLILEAIMSNPKGSETFIFDNNAGFARDIIKILEKFKISSKFIEFLRFFLINIYSTKYKPEELLAKRLLFRKYEEIPLYEFLGDLRTEKILTIDSNKQTKVYRQGITNDSNKENILELYYISKCRELNDNDNFIAHDKPIKIDFSMLL